MITVKDLIDRLSICNPNAEVVIESKQDAWSEFDIVIISPQTEVMLMIDDSIQVPQLSEGDDIVILAEDDLTKIEDLVTAMREDGDLPEGLDEAVEELRGNFDKIKAALP